MTDEKFGFQIPLWLLDLREEKSDLSSPVDFWFSQKLSYATKNDNDHHTIVRCHGKRNGLIHLISKIYFRYEMFDHDIE